MSNHIAIIGAGITGVTTAYSLLMKGFDVSVFECESHAALGTSHANGGQISASNAEAWNKWRTILKGLNWLSRQQAPLSFNLSPNRYRYRWLAEFLLATRHYKGTTQETVRLALMARDRLDDITAREAISFDQEKRGILHLHKDRRSFKAAHRTNSLLVEAGLERYPVTPSEIRKIEPAIAGHLEGGFYTPGDRTGDMYKFTGALAATCAGRGAVFHYGARVTSITPMRLNECGTGVVLGWEAGPADPAVPPPPSPPPSARSTALHRQRFKAVVICAGCSSRTLAHLVGDRVNVYPVKGYSLTLALPVDCPAAAAPWVSLLDEQAKIVSSRLGARRYRVAGRAEIDGYSRTIEQGPVEVLRSWVAQTHPHLQPETITPWAGLRPTMPDMMPAIRPGRHPSVFYNTGHGHLGWTLSAATAEIAAALVENTVGHSPRGAASQSGAASQPGTTAQNVA